MKAPSSVEPMSQRMTVQFPYKHSTGEVTGRFLAGLKEQKKIWGRRIAGQGVVVPPNSYSEIDAKTGGEWVEVKDEGTVTAVGVVAKPVTDLHPSDRPFAFVLVKLDGADTALAHIVKDRINDVKVGSRVKAVWAGDDERKGTIRDIACFQLVG
jgi:uncharacterized OB-fold protein